MKKRMIFLLAACFLIAAAGKAVPGINTRPGLPDRATMSVIRDSVYVNIFSKDRTFVHGRFLYSDQKYLAADNIPPMLYGMLYWELPFDGNIAYRCIEAGRILALAYTEGDADMSPVMTGKGFTRVDSVPAFILYGKEKSATVAVFTRKLTRGETLTMPSRAILTGFAIERKPATGELLYNGIRLPKEWPPLVDWRAPMPVPWLEDRPKLVNIDVGRQLFVDSFLIESTSMTPEYHYPEKYEGNPVLKAETDIEKNGAGGLASACPKSGGVWWNHEQQLFEMWYEAGWVSACAYATSRDGIHWDRPNLSVRPGTNQIIPKSIKEDSWTVVRDFKATDPKQNYKFFLRGGSAKSRMRGFVSEDGKNWGNYITGGLAGDRSGMFFNPFRMKWVYTLRWIGPGQRVRAYWEADDFLEGVQWLPDEPYAWTTVDAKDLPDPRIGDRTQLYNLDAVAYESIMLGFYQIHFGPENNTIAAEGLPKNTGLTFAYSRDGFHWHRPDRTIAIKSEWKDAWDRGYVQSLGNICTVVGDRLWFYYSAFEGDTTRKLGQDGITNNMYSGTYANGATGIAILRRDGFVSMNATGAQEGILLTRPVTFSGKYLFVNFDGGSIAAEIVDMHGNAVAGYSFADCIPATGNSTIARISWQNGGDLSYFNNKAVRIRFRVSNGKFYAFWVSRDDSGRSDGYVAGGGPGYYTNMDNVGKAALDAIANSKGGM
jgi:hypothetical protein